MGVVTAEVEPPPSGGVAPAASLLQGFASRLDVEAGEVLDELRVAAASGNHTRCPQRVHGRWITLPENEFAWACADALPAAIQRH